MLERERFFVGEFIANSGELLWLKAAREPSSVAAEDLQNEVEWLGHVGELFADAENFWRSPSVYWASGDGRWALFEHIEGRLPEPEDELEFLTNAGTHILADLLDVVYDIDGDVQDVNNWLRARIGRGQGVVNSDHFSQHDRRQFQKLLGAIAEIDFVRPGLVHGDFKLGNLILTKRDDNPVVLIDPEFGTAFDRSEWDGTRRRTEWDKPRMHDVAYFSHLIHVSNRSPQLAESILPHLIHCLTSSGALIDEDKDILQAEFHLSLLERTVSMLGHFVLSSGKETSEPNRLDPKPYVELFRGSLNHLRTFGFL